MESAGWHPDPQGRHEYRWWDGSQWTDQVADGGVVGHDAPSAAAGWDKLEPRQRVWRDADVTAYRVPARFTAAFGDVTMPTAGLRAWKVVGESYYQEALALVAGPKTPEGVWVEKVATLRPEPDNPHDDQAVAVVIDGRLVGHLPHADATTHRRLIDRTIAAHGTATCAAVINGGCDRPISEGHPLWVEGSYGVRLYWGYANPTAAATILPPSPDEERIPYRPDEWHDSITVTGEEHAQDALAATLGDEFAGDHPARLAMLGMGDNPKGRQVVTVTIDGRIVGWLTPKMSSRFQPAVEAVTAAGHRLTAHATLQPATRQGHEDEIDVILIVPKGWGRTTT